VIETFGNGKVRSWASVLDDQTREQAVRTAYLPIVSAPIALMPDAHLGAGATIGTVLVTENAVIPMAVGVDIGCGMAARKLALTLDDLDDLAAGRWVNTCAAIVPAGLGRWHGSASDDALRWIDRNPPPDALKDRRRIAEQLGTLGSGNHFIELSVDEQGGVWLLLHSGSRGAGNKLAQLHAKAAVAMNGDHAPDRDLAWLDAGTPEFDAYVRDLYWSQAYASENRRELLASVHTALESVVERPIAVEDEVNCHHNYAVFEEVAELGRPMYVTRKGAISARRGDRGLIPGAMGQASFVVTGLGNPASYESCAHGAGRVMSRTRARKELSTDEFMARMEGVAWQDADATALLDEAPQSYKDVETVMRDQVDLVSIDHRLKAIANYKGVESVRRRSQRRHR
jgi:tRNA-splicing ligase RtcB (3'-phosphate/5'-hydroxy nucleic acid ligase)